jgi:hypothetical protein
MGEPRRGVFLLALLVLAANLAAATLALPRLLRAFGVEASPLAGALVWFAGQSAASQATVVMPEGLLLPLAVLGAALLVEARTWTALLAGGLSCSLAAAVKPTAAVALAAVPLALAWGRDTRALARWKLVALVAAMAFPLWWYTAHATNLAALAQGAPVFAVGRLDPAGHLADLGPVTIAGLLGREPHQGQLPIFTGWWFVIAAFVLGEGRFAWAYLASLLAGMALGGRAVIDHGYYFAGSSLFACLLMARVAGAAAPRWARVVTMACLLWGVGWGIRVNLWQASRSSGNDDLWRLGRQVRELIPPGTHLVTDDGAYPRKLLFVGRSGTAADDRLQAVAAEPAYRARALALLRTARDTTADPDGRRLRSATETWELTIVPAGTR